ncbi:MAG: phosphoribosylformylglycinamidine synthase [Bacteroidales bacterium]|jgi:phosphoribosylformylglycinamidine synthase|nr:phosphoribosylformylglycinamidine synthase [Bacteroidales bacterium]
MCIFQKTRLFIEKKKGFQVEAESLKNELNHNLHLLINELRLIVVYDVFNIDERLLERAITSVFSEPVTDDVTVETFCTTSLPYFAIEFLPGQFDQRADSASQCLKLLDPKSEAIIKSSKLFLFDDSVTEENLQRIKKYCINEVEAREKNMDILDASENVEIADILVFNGFIEFSEDEIENFRKTHGLAMSLEDILFVQNYFKNDEQRDPTETEIKVLDTYWSDHCRHTTFETEIEKVSFAPSLFQDKLQDAFNQYVELRKYVHGGKKPMTLMDLATICGKYERKSGNLEDMEVSEEINACSIFVDVDVDGKVEKWLLMFKNETHNHPTEIEPFGGASTCVGGAIRDPLSGRSYVYQAMRVTGAGDITEPVENTMEGKLPQCVISKTAAHGYSSYGNQIGLACTHVREIYHDGYKAKRMEIGAVVGAVPADYVRREKPTAGDIVIMFGGRTGRDGIGGATGSSKEHTETSLELCAAEVQKGNPPEERKIQRLFRNPEVTRLIKKSNDFGAGGVSVAIGELADGLEIDLNAVKTKYKGLNGTELAISESQERMSVVVAPEDVEIFIEHCRKENIEATVIARVTDDNRLKIKWNGNTIVNISRQFINTSGVRQKTNIKVNILETIRATSLLNLTAKDAKGLRKERKVLNLGNLFFATFAKILCAFAVKKLAKTNLQKHIESILSDLNIVSQQNMIEMFDSTIGATTVLMPFGGKYQLSETQASVQKLPVRNGYTDTCSILTFGYNPFISECSPFHGAQYAIIESMAKIVAVGGDYRKIRFTFQEYFEKLGKDEEKWGKPFAALLGALSVQNYFHLPAIGGKDSMSGTFKHLNVPPTLVSFAVATEKAYNIISPEFKKPENHIYLIKHKPDKFGNPNLNQLKEVFNFMVENIHNKKIISVFTCQFGGIIEALCKMSFGNNFGFDIHTQENLFCYNYGSFIVETEQKLTFEHANYLGKVADSFIINDEIIDKTACLKAWQS